MMAINDARLSRRCLTHIVTACSSVVWVAGTIEDAAVVLRTKGPKRLSPFMLPRLISNLAPGWVSILTGARGPNWSPVSACATGAHSLGEAVHMIRTGTVNRVIAGGAEATITPLGVAGFAAMKALSTRNEDPTRASRPFDTDVIVWAEGAGVMVLESGRRCTGSGRSNLCGIAGYGQSSDAYHMHRTEGWSTWR